MEGIVLKSISYKEKSKLVYLYTSEGMKSVLVRSLKQNLSFTTTLNQVSFVMTEHTLPTLVSYELLDSYYDLDLRLVGYVMVMIQVIEALSEELPHHRIYPFFIKCLKLLVSAKQPLFYFSLFLVKMLAVFGVRPQFDICVRCGKEEVVSFSVADGGALCEQCSIYEDTTEPVYHHLKALYEDKSYEEDRFQIDYKPLLEAVYRYYAIHTSIHLKSYQNGLDK